MAKRGRPPVVSPGQRYDRLLVLAETAERDNKQRVFRCWCDCGTMAKVRTGHLREGRIRSCGCLLRDVNRERMRRIMTTHGATVGGKLTPEFQSWTAMKARCLNPNATHYEDYGGRGITICDRWRQGFENFLADMGPRPSGTSIDRIDVNGNYEPGNCRWATAQEQADNRRGGAMPNRPCLEAGCPNFAVYRGRCRECARKREHKVNRVGRALYSSKKWRNTRKRKLFTQPICELQHPGCTQIAEEVHHRTALKDGGKPYSMDNLVSACKSCHSKETRQEQLSSGVGWPE